MQAHSLVSILNKEKKSFYVKDKDYFSLFAFLFLNSLLLLVEASSFYYLALNHFFFLFILTHFLLSAILAGLYFSLGKNNPLMAYTTFLFVFLSFFGPIYMIVACFFYLITPPEKQSFKHWLDSVTSFENKEKVFYLYERLLLSPEDKLGLNLIVPYQNIIKYGTVDMKRYVLKRIYDFYDPSFSQLLDNALEDPNNEVRVQAASIKSNLEYKYVSQLSLLSDKLKKSKDIKTLIKYGVLCAEYANSGLIGQEQREEFINKAIDVFQKVLKKEENHLEAREKLADLYIQKGWVDKAKKLLDIKVEDLKKQNIEFVRKYMHVCYLKKDYQKMREVASKMIREPSKEMVKGGVPSFLSFWETGYLKKDEKIK